MIIGSQSQCEKDLRFSIRGITVLLTEKLHTIFYPVQNVELQWPCLPNAELFRDSPALLCCRKPRPVGVVRVQWLCRLNSKGSVKAHNKLHEVLSPQHESRQSMSRFQKLSYTIWHCQYHVVWTPKCRLRVLEGTVGQEVASCIRAFSDQKSCDIVELNVQRDHVHLVVMVPKLSISDYMGLIKGRTAIRVFNKFRNLKEKPYWGNHFWSRGYFIDTVGLGAEKICLYVKYQEEKERRANYNQQQLF